MTKPIDSDDFRLAHDALARRERRPVTVRATVTTDDGTAQDALVLDLSHEGCGIETPLLLTPGQPITLSVDGSSVRATVRWYSQGKAGLVFDEEQAKAAGGQELRGDERVPLRLVAMMRRLGKPSYTVTVSDLSPHGCKVDVVERPRVGEHLLIKFDDLAAIDCEVCWVQDYVAGLHFERPIHSAVYELMVQKLAARG